jgi:RNA polymerase sigma factor (sigma-70 family)
VTGLAPETYRKADATAEELITEIYNRYGKKLYSYSVRTWNVDEDTSWDLVYKTIYKVIESYKGYTFESEEKFASFIFRIFINYLRNHYRDSKRIGKDFKLSDIDSEEIQDKEEPAAPAEESRKMKALREELEKMEDWQRMLLLMRSEGMAYSKIAGFIDKPENQLKVYYQRLKEQISKKLNERL